MSLLSKADREERRGIGMDSEDPEVRALDTIDAWQELAEAQQDLVVCYRLGSRDPGKVIDRVTAAKAALAAVED